MTIYKISINSQEFHPNIFNILGLFLKLFFAFMERVGGGTPNIVMRYVTLPRYHRGGRWVLSLAGTVFWVAFCFKSIIWIGVNTI